MVAAEVTTDMARSTRPQIRTMRGLARARVNPEKAASVAEKVAMVVLLPAGFPMDDLVHPR
jgi:hypothetical protein